MQVLETLIFPVIEEFRTTLADPTRLKSSVETKLLGDGAAFDSLALVSFLLALEQRIEEQTGQHVTLVNERAMSRSTSPFRTVGLLSDYVTELLNEAKHG
jgi:acyl carrier protein